MDEISPFDGHKFEMFPLSRWDGQGKLGVLQVQWNLKKREIRLSA